MSTVINDDFSTDTSTNYTGGPAHNVSGGLMNVTAAGFIVENLHDLGAGDVWLLVTLSGVSGNNLIVVGANGSGTGGACVVETTATNVRVRYMTHYTTYTTDDIDQDFGFNDLGAGTVVGITIDKTNHIARYWLAPTGAPTSITSWNSSAALVSFDFTSFITLDGNRVGMGNWSGTGTTSFNSFVAGDFSSGGTATLTGTITSSTTETNIRAGGKTIILTLTGDTYVAAGTGPIGSSANTQALIDGIDSAQSEVAGWDALVKLAIRQTDVVRTSSTVATITLPGVVDYNITATETITATVPGVVLVGTNPLVATPTFTVSSDGSTPEFQDLTGAMAGM